MESKVARFYRLNQKKVDEALDTQLGFFIEVASLELKKRTIKRLKADIKHYEERNDRTKPLFRVN